MTRNYTLLATAIVKHQESIVGPLARSEAGKVSGVVVTSREITLEGEGKRILENLVRQYETLFGQASVEACKDAIRPLLPKLGAVDLPQNLL